MADNNTQRNWRMLIGLALVIALGFTIGHLSRQASDSAAPEPPTERTTDSVERAHQLRRAMDAIRVDGERPMVANDDSASHGGLSQHPEPAEKFVTRPPGEWRGMLVNEAWTWACDPQTPCTNARACIDNQCLACRADSDCLTGESCALDHCVKRELLECSTYTECDDGALCALSGVTHGTRRGNEDMRAYCVSPTGGFSSADPDTESSRS